MSIAYAMLMPFDSNIGSGFVKNFNRKLRDEPLNRAWFCRNAEAKVLIERWPQL